MPDWRRAVEHQARASGLRLPQAMVDEIALHLEDLHAAALADGASAGEAEMRARQALEESSLSVLRRPAARDPRHLQAGNADDTARAAGRRSLDVTSAIRTALRQFRHHPSVALVVVLVLGLGTAAATTVFTVVDSVVLRPLPYAHPDRLVTLWDTNSERGLSHDPISPVTFMDQRALPVFEDAAAWWRPGVNLADPGLDPVRVATIEVTGNLFDVLGVKPQVGAGFPAKGPLFASELIAVISDRLWRVRYGADPSIVGRQLSFNSTPYTIAGVMPPKFHYPDDIDVWQRLRWDPTQHSRRAHFMEAVLRLADGTTFDQAQSAIAALGLRVQSEFPESNAGWSSRLVPLLEERLGYYRPALLVLFGAVGLLLLIGVLNVASLLLTRALAREREMAVRIAMGAAPRQLVTQLMAESLVLSFAGTLVGVLAASAALPAVVALSPVAIPRLEEATLNWRTLGLGLGLGAATTVFFGLVPALLLLRGELTSDLKSGERGSSRTVRRTYWVLVVGEVALACALLVSSALLVRTVRQMMLTPTGVDAGGVLTTTVQMTRTNVPQSASILEQWRVIADTHSRILETIRQQPGVVAAGGTNFLPFEVGWRNPFAIEGEPPPPRPEDAPQAQFHSVSEGYFESMGAALVEGRTFTPFDGPDSTGIVVVNETFARRFLEKGGAVGRALRIYSTGIGPLGVNLKAGAAHVPGGMHFEIGGVIRDVRNVPLGQTIEPAVYFTTRQFPFSDLFLAIRASDPGAARTAVRTAIRHVAPDVPIATVLSWDERAASRTAEARLLMTTLTFFAGLAALLAALGVYGLFSWSVAIRTRELAIRMTLGARPAGVGALVVRQSVLLVVIGLLAGWAIVRGAQSILARVVFGISPNDAMATASASALLLLAALVACVPPAMRAMRVDPVEGLRTE